MNLRSQAVASVSQPTNNKGRTGGLWPITRSQGPLMNHDWVTSARQCIQGRARGGLAVTDVSDSSRVTVTPQLGNDATIDPGATLGYAYCDDPGPTVLGDDATVRSGTIIYADVSVGDGFTTGHDALVREHTTVGDDVLLGTGAVIDGRSTIGDNVSIQTGVYLPSETTVEDGVFLGPYAVSTNDAYPLRVEPELVGPTIREHASIGANTTLLPGVTVGERAFVAAGAVVTEDVPPETLAVGVPAIHRPLPDELRRENVIA